MAGDRDIRGVITSKHIIQHLLAPNVLISRHLTHQWLPEEVLLAETGLDQVRWEAFMDEGAIAAAITGVSANAFAEELFDRRNERVAAGQIKTCEGDVGCLETAVKWRGVVALWSGNLLHCDFRCPEGVRLLSLGNPCWVDVCICPGRCGVAITLRPVALDNVLVERVL